MKENGVFCLHMAPQISIKESSSKKFQIYWKKFWNVMTIWGHFKSFVWSIRYFLLTNPGLSIKHKVLLQAFKWFSQVSCYCVEVLL